MPTSPRYFHLDPHLIHAQVRPQKRHWCSVAAVTTAFNRLYGTSLTQSQVFRIYPQSKLRTWSMRKGKWIYPGNRKVMDLFLSLCQAFGVPGDAFALPGGSGTRRAREAIWTSLRACVEHPETTAIYHMSGHYACVAGVYQNTIPGKRVERFLIISDSSTGNRDRRAGDHRRILKGYPLWCISLMDLLDDISARRNRGLIYLGKNPRNLALIRGFL